MKHLELDIHNVYPFLSEEEINAKTKEAADANAALHNKTRAGKEALGWVNLPEEISENHVQEITKIADDLKSKTDAVVVVGIGGSYLGARAVIEALSDNFSHLKTNEYPEIFYAGHNLSEDYLSELREVLANKSWGIVVISKSGTTTEPGIAFRVLKKDIEEQFGKEEAQSRIIAITDKEKGALRQLADNEGYDSFVIPDDVGGRYSVLTPVGLVPIAIAGYDIAQLVAGAKDFRKNTLPEIANENNPPQLYAIIRNILYKKSKTIENLINYEPRLGFFAEWWKQLYGESEGKQEKGIYPSSATFTTDLHSKGQFIQEGSRNIFETLISITSPDKKLTIPNDPDNLDNLNYLAGKRIDEVNKKVELGTQIAHIDGGVPNIKLEIPQLNEYHLGELIYFFEKACGISGYLMNINPFNQPGVEAYKKNMFALLGKPGFEEETKKIRKRLE